MQLFKICNRFCSILQNVPKELVDLKHSNFLNVRTAYLEHHKDEYILSLEFKRSPDETDDALNVTNNVELSIDPELTVSEFIENCQEYLKDNVTLYSIEKTPFAGVNTMEQVIKEPFYLLTSKQHLFFVKSVSGYDKDEYSYIKQYFTKNNVPLMEKNILIQYLVRMDYLLQQNFKLQYFKNNSQSQSRINYDDLVKVVLDSYTNMRNTQSDHESDMYTQYYQLKQAREQLEDKRKDLMEKATRFAKLQMFGGFLVLCGHFCFMGAGIYVYYNWDVMEPIGYFLNTGGMIYLSYQYFKLNDEWSHSKFSNYLINKNFARLSKMNNFDVQKLDKINKQIQEIQDRIKTNIITNL